MGLHTLFARLPNACAKQSIPFISPKFLQNTRQVLIYFLSHTLKLNRIIEQFLFLHPSDHKSFLPDDPGKLSQRYHSTDFLHSHAITLRRRFRPHPSNSKTFPELPYSNHPDNIQDHFPAVSTSDNRMHHLYAGSSPTVLH